MSESVHILTAKGQVTIPIDVRRALGLRPGDRVAIVLQDHQAVIKPAKSVAERTYGIFPARRRPEDFKELRDIALDEAFRQDN